MAKLRAIVMGSFMGQSAWTVLHFDAPDYVTTDLNALAIDIRDNYCQFVKPRMTAEFSFINIQTQPVFGSPDAAFNLTVAIVGTAGGSATTLPSTCCVLRLFTGLAGKHGRGRIYLPCLGPACLSFGLITPACITAYQTTADQILARYGPTGPSAFTLQVLNRSDLSSGLNVTAISPRTTPGNQRRRGIGIGI